MSENQIQNAVFAARRKIDVRTINLTGQTFGRLYVNGILDRIKNQIRWDCTCACGKRVPVFGMYLRGGSATCCGCEGSEERERIMREEKDFLGKKRGGVKLLPSAAYLNACFTYNPLTGDLIWKERPASHFQNVLAWKMWSAHYAGTLVGRKQFKVPSKERHAIVVKVGVCGFNQSFLAHRVIFAMLGMEIPVGMQIDHINNDPFDNRLANLRLATGQQNCYNQKKSHRRGKLPKGVHQIKKSGLFQASIRKHGRYQVLGYFKNVEEAAQAYVEEAKKLHGDFFCSKTTLKQTTHVAEWV